MYDGVTPHYGFHRIVVFILLSLSLFLSAPAMAAITPLSFTVNVSENVVVDTTGGTPSIAIDVGGVARTASYASGSGSAALVFSYTPVVGDVDLDGIAVSSPIVLNGGTIRDAAGNNATLTFTPPNTANVKINYPSLSMDFIADADGRYTLNGTAYNDLPAFLTATGGTFTRASIGTYFDSSGVLQTAASGAPRFDYDPVALTPKGILIEESRTNLLLRSSNFDDASWSKNNTSILTNATLAPDGTNSAQKLIENSLNNSHSVSKGTAVTSGINYTYSVYVKASERSYTEIRYLNGTNTQQFSIIVDLSNGTYTTSGVPAGTGIFTRYVGNGWYRCGFTMTSNDTTFKTLIHVRPNQSNQTYLGDNTSGIYVWGAQLEAGTFPTSYIPTTTAAVTRNADSLTIPTGGWFNASAGSFMFQGDVTAPIFAGTLVALSAGASYNAGNGFLVRYGLGNPQAGGNCCSVGISPNFTANNTFKVSASYNGTTHRIATSALIGTNTNNDFTGVGTTTFLFGALNTNSAQSIGSGHTSVVKYYPVAPTNTQLQLLAQ